MAEPENGLDEAARNRRDLIRKASRLTIAFFAAGLAIAIAGAALIALLLRFTGLPFLETWLVLGAITLVVALGLTLWSARRS